ncbi:MAG: hypothetical protein R3B49_02780 [Phycisphaerales bacterium]
MDVATDEREPVGVAGGGLPGDDVDAGDSGARPSARTTSELLPVFLAEDGGGGARCAKEQAAHDLQTPAKCPGGASSSPARSRRRQVAHGHVGVRRVDLIARGHVGG